MFPWYQVRSQFKVKLICQKQSQTTQIIGISNEAEIIKVVL